MGQFRPTAEQEEAAERFKEGLARWASTVTVLAVRDPDDDAVHATTVTSFAPLGLYPPMVVASLSPNAQALPFVSAGTVVGISLLAEDQARWGRRFSEAYPVGPMPWPDEGVPLIPGAVTALTCTVEDVHPTESASRLVVCRVERVALGEQERPALYWNRDYRRLESE